MFIQRGGRIISVIEICSFLAARVCYCYNIFYCVWAEPQLNVYQQSWGGGDKCHDLYAMMFAAAQGSTICPDFNLCVPTLVNADRDASMSWFQCPQKGKGLIQSQYCIKSSIDTLCEGITCKLVCALMPMTIGGGCTGLYYNGHHHTAQTICIVMLVCIDAFYRRPGENSICPVLNLRVPLRVGANRRVWITAF